MRHSSSTQFSVRLTTEILTRLKNVHETNSLRTTRLKFINQVHSNRCLLLKVFNALKLVNTRTTDVGLVRLDGRATERPVMTLMR